MPAPGQIISSGNTLTAGIRTNFWDTYKGLGKVVEEEIGAIIDLNLPSNKLTEIYAYYQSAPHWKQWIRGQERVSKGFKSVQFSVTNKDWEVGVPFHENDENDDQTGSMLDMAKDAGANGAVLDSRVTFQIMQGSSDSQLLESIPNAPDGAALYSATDGSGGNRFGISGGNLLTGAGVTSGAVIRGDLFDAISRAMQFQDTEGQTLMERGIFTRGVAIYYSASLLQEFAEAFQQARTVQATAAAQASTGAAVSNVVMDAGFSISLHPTARITGNSWYIFFTGVRKRALFKQVRQPIREFMETMENSDIARRTKVKSLMWDARYGYGVALPYGTIKVSNS